MNGCLPPDGSRVVATGHYDEYALVIYLGTDRSMYFLLHPKKRGQDGKPILAKMFSRANILSRNAGYPPIDHYGILDEA